ncbi:MAG: nucleotidyltransferase domain-containing protein [Candidatus Omnitrophota bacterium]
MEKSLDDILTSKLKIAIIRLFVSKTSDFKATGREIAKLIDFSAPAAHAALKELYNHGVLKLETIGKQHIYTLDNSNRVVQKILKPLFREEKSLKDEVKNFLIKHIRKAGIEKKIISLLLYGSLQRGEANQKSDIDIAVIIRNKKDKEGIEEKFLNHISVKFYDYFKVHLDTYIKTADEFRPRLKRNLPPVSTLMKSYSVIYGREPLDV